MLGEWQGGARAPGGQPATAEEPSAGTAIGVLAGPNGAIGFPRDMPVTGLLVLACGGLPGPVRANRHTRSG